MITRIVSATITEVNGQPREGLRVEFRADDPALSTHAITDASGVFLAELEVGMTYCVPVGNAVTVNGVAYPAGTIFTATVPEGEGLIDLTAVAVGVEDWSGPAIASRFAELEATLAEIQSTISSLDTRINAMETL